MKYIIELEKIEGTNLYKAKGANTLVFDEKGIKNILTPYKEEQEVDWTKVPKDTKVLVSDNGLKWYNRHFCKLEEGTFYCYAGGNTSFTTDDETNWRYCKLAEEEE